jgi:hypothetical protein
MLVVVYLMMLLETRPKYSFNTISTAKPAVTSLGPLSAGLKAAGCRLRAAKPADPVLNNGGFGSQAQGVLSPRNHARGGQYGFCLRLLRS